MNSIKTQLLTCLLLVLFAEKLSAQEDTDGPSLYLSSPSAAELGSYGEMPLGMHTGTVEVNIPLCELRTRNLSLPISLNYRSSGFQVNKLSSNVGFDWSLFAGGVITRIVKGHPDMHSRFHTVKYPVDPDKALSALTEQEKTSLSNFFFSTWEDEADTQPDLFAYNFMGHSGQFYIGDDGEVIPVPYEKLKIVVFSPSITITTPDGIIYEFQGTELADGFTIMTYHLSRILHPEGDEIRFNYKHAGSYWYRSDVSDNSYYFSWDSEGGISTPCSDNAVPALPYAKAHKSQTVSSVVLESIEAVGYGEVVFQTDDNRLDLPALRVKGMKVFNSAGEIIRSVALEHQFPYTTNYSNAVALAENGMFNGDNVNYRMFLDAVSIKGSNGVEEQRYLFEYNDLSGLPIRLSYSQDHWGYFNGASNTRLLPDHIPPVIKSTYFDGVVTNADRNPNPEYAQKGMLTKVRYPTGGFTVFDYEGNRNYVDVDHGGVRVAEQRNYNFNGHQTTVKRYSYANPVAQGDYGSISYFRTYSFSTLCWEFGYNPIGPYQHDYTVHWLSSRPVNPPGHVVYGQVTVNYDDNNQYGREVHEFITARDGRGDQLYGQFLPMPVEMINLGWKNGLKKAERFYSGEDLVRSVTYDYHEDPRLERSKSFVTVQRILPGANGYVTYNHIGTYFNVMSYSIISKWNYLRSKTIKEFRTGEDNPVITDIEYGYDNENHTQLTRESVTTSAGDEVLTRRYYPEDYSPATEFTTLINKFMLNRVVDERVYRGNQLVSGRQTKFNEYGQPLVTYLAELTGLASDIAFNANAPYTFTPRTSYQYSLKHLLTSSRTNAGVTTSYLWSYNATLPVAKILNADYTEVSNSLSGLDADFISDLADLCDQAGIEMKLDALRIRLGDDLPASSAMTYTHIPQLGLRSLTDINGRTSYFEYDHFGRLATVSDHDENVIETYGYNYIPVDALPRLEVTPGILWFDHQSGAKTYEIDSRGGWEIVADEEWIQVSTASGTGEAVVGVTVEQNTDFTSRVGSITVRDVSGHQLGERTVSISQQARPNYVDISHSNLNFGHSAENMSFTITSDVEWGIVSDAPWISVSQSSGVGNNTIVVTTTQNDSFSSRTTLLTVSDLSGNGSPDQTINIRQLGKPSHLNTSLDALHFETAGGTKTFEVESNVAWSVTPNQSWIDVSPVAGNGNGIVSVVAINNTGSTSRTGLVSIVDQSGGGNSGHVSVVQPGTENYITVFPSYLYLHSSQSGGEFNVYSDLSSWSIRITYVNGNDWLEVYPEQGFFNRSCDIEILQSPPNGQTWQAEIEVYNITEGISAKIPIYVGP